MAISALPDWHRPSWVGLQDHPSGSRPEALRGEAVDRRSSPCLKHVSDGFLRRRGAREDLFNELKARGLARESEDGVSIPMHPRVRVLVMVRCVNMAQDRRLFYIKIKITKRAISRTPEYQSLALFR